MVGVDREDGSATGQVDNGRTGSCWIEPWPAKAPCQARRQGCARAREGRGGDEQRPSAEASIAQGC